MKNLTATLCLTITVLLGGMGVSESSDSQKGLIAASGHSGTSIRKITPLPNPENAKLVTYPTYEIENFPSEVHGGVRATWDITQDEQGVLYFANTGGILNFLRFNLENNCFRRKTHH